MAPETQGATRRSPISPVLVTFMPLMLHLSQSAFRKRLILIIAGLRGVLAAHMAKDRSAVFAVRGAGEGGPGRRLPPGPAPRMQTAGDLELPRLAPARGPAAAVPAAGQVRLADPAGAGGGGLWRAGAVFTGRPGQAALLA
ncbi:MAG: hypothetical protein JOY71_22345, partial [Acetobacteraceae bacterium]|nr:hypothetical protein [Acetobacteraceae bacterium]